MGHNIPSYLGPELCGNTQGYEKIAREKIGIKVSARRFELFSRHATVRFGPFNIHSVGLEPKSNSAMRIVCSGVVSRRDCIGNREEARV